MKFYITFLFIVNILRISASKDENKSFALVADDFGEVHNISLFSNVFSQRIRSGKPEFRLYTRRSSSMELLYTDNLKVLSESSFSPKTKTWIYTHGWLGNGLETKVLAVKEAYLATWDVNVIILDWSIAASNRYYHAKSFMMEMATELSNFLKFLSNSGYHLSNINMVGHSLGAHMMGIASKRLQGETVASITGLDPASLYFKMANPEGRLSDTDAPYVEVIHTNAGVSGFLHPIGHVDIYVNGGTIQPECGVQVVACPHFRAINVYERSIKNPIIGVQCANMGEAMQNKCGETSEYKLRIGGYLPKEWVKGVYSYSTV